MAPARSKGTKGKSGKPATADATRKKSKAVPDGHAAVEAWIEQVNPALRPIVKRLDEVIRQHTPGLRYAIKWNAPFYGLPDKGWIISLAAFKAHVDVNFFGGADLKPPPPHGESKRMRHAKVTSLAEVEDPRLRSWIAQSQDVPGWSKV